MTSQAPGTCDISTVVNSAQKLDYKTIVEAIPEDVQVVLIGEASHGTEEFYKHRAEISKLLIADKGFRCVALEADYPDTCRVSQYVMHDPLSRDVSAEQSMRDYSRYPLWMWRNTIVQEFVTWMRERNGHCDIDSRCQLLGLDIYSFKSSKEAVLSYIEKHHPKYLPTAEALYSFSKHSSDGLKRADAVLKELLWLSTAEAPRGNEELFSAIQNAYVVKGGAEYYNSSDLSWNVRDTCMFDALNRHIARYGDKIIVWAHNSHLGDATQTERSEQGKINLGELVRKKYLDRCRNIGFTTYTGSVTASDKWDEPAQFKPVNPGMQGSVERLFHGVSKSVQSNEFVLFLKDGANQDCVKLLNRPLLERAIGVIYKPRTERWSHYCHVKLSSQFDIVIHVDRSNALRPLDVPRNWTLAEQEYLAASQ